jgi:hypothetical protein
MADNGLFPVLFSIFRFLYLISAAWQQTSDSAEQTRMMGEPNIPAREARSNKPRRPEPLKTEKAAFRCLTVGIGWGHTHSLPHIRTPPMPRNET